MSLFRFTPHGLPVCAAPLRAATFVGSAHRDAIQSNFVFAFQILGDWRKFMRHRRLRVHPGAAPGRKATSGPSRGGCDRLRGHVRNTATADARRDGPRRSGHRDRGRPRDAVERHRVPVPAGQRLLVPDRLRSPETPPRFFARAAVPTITLFVEPRDRDAEIWNGYRPGVEGAIARLTAPTRPTRRRELPGGGSPRSCAGAKRRLPQCSAATRQSRRQDRRGPVGRPCGCAVARGAERHRPMI